MTVRLMHLVGAQIDAFQRGMSALEDGIEYPIIDDAFTISHGDHYNAFFAGLGEPHYIVAHDDGHVVGSLCAVARSVRYDGRALNAIYLCDFKVAKRYRGGGLTRRMLRRCLVAWPFTKEARRARLFYLAAMRGDGGDVTRTARGMSPLGLMTPLTQLAVFFAEPARLAQLDASAAPPPPPGAVLDMSPKRASGDLGIVRNLGVKDLVLMSTKKPWPLAHLAHGPTYWLPTYIDYLRACGDALTQGDPAVACFAIDARRSRELHWLADRDILPGGVCTVYALPIFAARRASAFVHLSTSEI
jgi:hypothetical protein